MTQSFDRKFTANLQDGFNRWRAHPLMRIPATLISYLFHPVFLTVVMSAALYFLLPAEFAAMGLGGAKKWLLNITLITVLFPLLTILLMRALGFVKSIQMAGPRERLIPLIAIMIFYFWMYQVARNAGTIPGSPAAAEAPLILRSLLFGSYLGIVLLFLVSIFYRVSMHSAAAGGMIGIMAIIGLTSSTNMATPFFIALGIAGLIGTARLVLRAHTQGEVWLGYLLGIIAQTAAWWWVQPTVS